MRILLTMLLSSNGLFLLFLLVERFQKDLFSQRIRYSILKLAVLFSVFPVAYIKFAVQALAEAFYPGAYGLPYRIDGKLPLIVKTADTFYINFALKVSGVVFAVWLCAVLFVCSRYFFQFAKFKRRILSLTTENVSDDAFEILGELQKKWKIRRTIELRMTNAEMSPFTLGIFRPIMIIPERIRDREEKEMIIAHELYHIKRWDTLVKMTALLSRMLYWFNPLSYYLCEYLETSLEYSCDEFLIKKMSIENRKKYAFLIFEMAEFDHDYSGMLTASLSRNKEKLKERGALIMRNNKKSSKLAFFLSMGMILISSMPVFACERVQTLTCPDEQYEFFLAEGTEHIITFWELDINDFVSKIDYPIQFTDEEGNVYEIGGSSTRKACQNHNYVDGTLTEHKLSGDGGCTVNHYREKRCSICGDTVRESYIKKETYPDCPH